MTYRRAGRRVRRMAFTTAIAVLPVLALGVQARPASAATPALPDRPSGTGPGSITGTVTAAAGGAALNLVNVELFSSSGAVINFATTAANGTYTLAGVAAGSGYTVCFNASGASGGTSTTGYASQCFHNIAWNGLTLPAGTTPVTVAAGTATTGIDAALVSAGGISGRATAASGGGGVAQVVVEVFDQTGIPVTSASTATNGTYEVTGLVPSALGYTVCFNPVGATGGGSTTGYAGQCWNNVPWPNTFTPPTGATPIPVSPGVVTTGINAALTSGGGIGGTVTASDGSPLAGVTVLAATTAGVAVTSATTAANGTYTLTGLASGSSYTVCFNASGATGGPSRSGYSSQCYQNVPWDGASILEAGTTPVTVNSGSLSTVNVILAPASGIAGKVTSAVGAAPLAGVSVDIFDSTGNQIASVPTKADGTYVIGDLATSTSGYTACFDASQATGGTSSSGYASQCYSGVSWQGDFLPEPSGTAPIAVLPGQTRTVNVSLSAAGAVTGVVTSPLGTPVQGVQAQVIDPSGALLGAATTAADGTFRIPGLQPTATGDYVCFDASGTPVTAESATGFASQCGAGVAWGGNRYAAVPATATPVPISAAASVVNATLSYGAAVSGTLTVAAGGTPLSGATVDVFDSAGDLVGSADTAPDGTYSVTDLTPSSGGDQVCFDVPAAESLYAPQCWNNVAWTTSGAAWSSGAPAPGATTVTVAASTITSGFNAALAAPAPQGLQGTVTAAGGSTGLSSVLVDVFDSTGQTVASTYTLSGGQYSLAVPPSATGYDVCFDGRGATTGTTVGGYASQCSGGVAWNPAGQPPAAAQLVPVTSGAPTVVGASLKAGGGLLGVVSGSGSTALANVTVDVYSASGALAASTVSDFLGNYYLTGLTAGSYAVCFDPSTAQTAGAQYGFSPECYLNAAWSANGRAAPGATVVAVKAGVLLSAVSITLTAAGAVAGTVTASTGAPLGGVTVDVFGAAGSVVATATTLSDGTYRVSGLIPSVPYSVCFDPSGAFGGAAKPYSGQCGTAVAWIAGSPLPAGVATVTPAAGATTTGVNASLTLAGGISGTVTSGGSPLSFVQVRVSDSAGNHAETFTGSNGTYSVTGLPASTTGYAVCFDGSLATGGTSTTGYLSICRANVAWAGGDAPAPAGAAHTVVKAGVTATGANGSLGAAGAITGKVTAATGGAAVEAVGVTVFNSAAQVVGAALTAPDGTYAVTGLAASTGGYTVCFDTLSAKGGGSATGYPSTCSTGKAWIGFGAPPAGTTPVPVTVGAAAVLNAALPKGGAISGTVTTGTKALVNVTVDVYNPAGSLVGTGTTAANGTYTVADLAASATGYTVCFDATSATAAVFAAGFSSGCYSGVVWTANGSLPAGTTPVVVTAGATATGVNANLTALAPPAAATTYAFRVSASSGVLTSQLVSAQPAASTNGAAAGAAGAGATADGCDKDDLPGGPEGPDDDGDECTFTVTADNPVPSGGADQATTPPGAVCDADTETADKRYADGVLVALAANGDTNAVNFLIHFLDGSGTPIIEPDGSNLSNLAKASSQFQKLDGQVQKIAKADWDAGTQHSTPWVANISWGYVAAAVTDSDLFYSFGGTQGLHLEGTAKNNRGSYVGNITYEFYDTYGWNDLPTGVPGFNDFRPAMNYLQTHCGAQPGKKGPAWFKSGVIVQVPIQ